MLTKLLAVAGLVCLTAAAAMIAAPLGLAVAGLSLLAIAVDRARA